MCLRGTRHPVGNDVGLKKEVTTSDSPVTDRSTEKSGVPLISSINQRPLFVDDVEVVDLASHPTWPSQSHA